MPGRAKRSDRKGEPATASSTPCPPFLLPRSGVVRACHTEFSFAAALAPLKLKLLSDARRQLLARVDLAPSTAAHAIRGLCSHYGYTIEDVEMWDKSKIPLEDVPAVPDEELADVREAENYLRRQLAERIGFAVEEAAAGTHDTLRVRCGGGMQHWLTDFKRSRALCE